MLGFIDSDASFLYLESPLSNSLHFSFQVLQERVEALQRQLHAVEKKLMRRELEYQEQVKLQTAWTSMYATSPWRARKKPRLLTESLICPTHILHIP